MPEQHLPFCLKERDTQSLPPRCSSQGCTGIISKPFEYHSMSEMDPLSITAFSTAVVGSFVQIASAIKKIRRRYKDANTEALHAHSQREQLQTNKSGLLDLPAEPKQCVVQAQDSFRAIDNSLPSQGPSGKKRDRLRWVFKNEKSVSEAIGSLVEPDFVTRSF
jgi:hypothetical protein